MKKLIIFMLFLLVSLSSCVSTNEEVAKTHKEYSVEHVYNYNIYTDVDNVFSTSEIVYFNELDNVPYIELNNAFALLKELVKKQLQDEDMVYSFQYKGDTVTINRENGSYCRIDSLNNTVAFDSYYSFSRTSFTEPGGFIFDYGKLAKETDNNVRFLASTSSYEVRHQAECVFNLDEYNIDIIYKNQKIYVPFTTFSDIFFGYVYCPLVVFSDGIYLSARFAQTKAYYDLYMSKSLDITDDLLEYNYNETCFNLDTFFGLKDALNYNNADEIFIANGLKEDALSSPEGFDYAINFYCNYILDDAHTAYLYNCPNDTTHKKLSNGYFYNNLIATYRRYVNYYNNHCEYKDDYVEIGNTAIINFRQFYIYDQSRYDKGIPTSLNECEDNNDLFIYAYSQITRPDSPIENIVVDTTMNSGGETGSLAYLLGFFMDEVRFFEYSPVDDSYQISGYKSDTNLDGVIDENDRLFRDKNIVVLTSGYTYSCANMFATYMANTNAILAGECSGGGACIVLPVVSPLGTCYQISGSIVTYTTKNNVNESVETGIDVDMHLSLEEIYDRELLVSIIRAKFNN